MISFQSQISCEFHVRKIQILLIFSWVNDFRKKYRQKQYKNDLQGVVVKYAAASFNKKYLRFDQNLLCFVSLYIRRSCLVLAACNKTNIPRLFLFSIEIIHSR